MEMSLNLKGKKFPARDFYQIAQKVLIDMWVQVGPIYYQPAKMAHGRFVLYGGLNADPSLFRAHAVIHLIQI